jgi:predicted metalloprotease
MAIWDKLGTRGNVEDRRLSGMGLQLTGGAGMAVVGTIIVLNLFGVNVDPGVLQQLSNGSTETPESSQFLQGKDYADFASTVVGSADGYWKQTLASEGIPYTPAKLVLFRQATTSGCGLATSSIGPHYCPEDQTIYLDETFFDDLKQQYRAEVGDVAQAYVIAHEVAHHVQNVRGTMKEIQSNPNYRQTGENSLSVRLELQADCFAGLWAHSIMDRGVFEPGEIQEALDAASSVGDDHIQSTAGGSVNPETWTHGSSADRKAAFDKGFQQGSLSVCAL